jgi:glutaredoxin-like YruB-family protein
MSLDVVTQSGPVLAALESGRPVVLGFFSEKSPVSEQARPAFEAFCAANAAISAFLVDVTVVRDLHARFEVSAIPTVLLVRDGMLIAKVTGAQTAAAYAKALKPQAPARPDAPFVDVPRSAPKVDHMVTVYTTDVCPWCVRVKTYLKQRGVRFREVNVQHDQQAARRMVERSGQQGVPQIDIDGRVVVGFDKPAIDSLLGLSGGRA